MPGDVGDFTEISPHLRQWISDLTPTLAKVTTQRTGMTTQFRYKWREISCVDMIVSGKYLEVPYRNKGTLITQPSSGEQCNVTDFICKWESLLT